MLTEEQKAELLSIFQEGWAIETEDDRHYLESFALYINENMMQDSPRSEYLNTDRILKMDIPELTEFIHEGLKRMPNPVLCGKFNQKQLTKHINRIK